jgi:DNA-directed RNA polymerase specialized sigma24 family protein
LTTFPNLTDDEWNELTIRLTQYAEGRMARLYWRGLTPKRGGTVPGGVGSDDIATEAILSVIEGRRSWSTEVEPFAFFCSVIDSLVSHLVESAENRKSRRMPDSEAGVAGSVELDGNAPDPFRVIADEEEAVRFRELVLKAIQNDPLALEMFQCIEVGIIDPRDIADTTGHPIQEIYTAKKRFKRSVDTAIRKHRQQRSMP